MQKKEKKGTFSKQEVVGHNPFFHFTFFTPSMFYFWFGYILKFKTTERPLAFKIGAQ